MKNIPIDKVTQQNNQGKLLLYKEKGSITIVNYLGSICTKSKHIYKILTFTWRWGQSHRATNRIMIYSDKNKYLGNYYVTTTDELPVYLQNDRLIFQTKQNVCPLKIDFDTGPPADIYNQCAGDIYKFDRG